MDSLRSLLHRNAVTMVTRPENMETNSITLSPDLKKNIFLPSDLHFVSLSLSPRHKPLDPPSGSQ